MFVAAVPIVAAILNLTVQMNKQRNLLVGPSGKKGVGVFVGSGGGGGGEPAQFSSQQCKSFCRCWHIYRDSSSVWRPDKNPAMVV